MADMTDTQYEDFLAHFGVKGMKWGKRKGGSGGSEGQSKSRDIKDARGRQKERVAELRTLDKAYNKEKSSAARSKIEKTIAKKNLEFLNSPDAITASRMTTGEKVIAGLLVGGAIVSAVATSGS